MSHHVPLEVPMFRFVVHAMLIHFAVSRGIRGERVDIMGTGRLACQLMKCVDNNI